MFGGLSIGLPPVINFGSKYLQDKVVRDCLSGRKFICLAITEPHAGSDVANIRTRAVKDASGKFYVVNGEKKWITNGKQASAAAPACVTTALLTHCSSCAGVFCDFFTVAVRTGGEGASGISLLLLERGMAGLETKQMKCMGVWPSGTTYITMDDVKVPVENLIGQENQGFKYIMYVSPCPARAARVLALTRVTARAAQVQLQPRAVGAQQPGQPLLARVPGGGVQVRDEAQHVWQEVDRAPRHPPEDCGDGAPGGVHARAAGEYHVSGAGCLAFSLNHSITRHSSRCAR